MNTVLMYVIMCLVCRFKSPGGESQAACLAHEKHVQIVRNSEIYFTIFIYFYHYIVALRCVACKQAAWDSRVQICIENCIPEMPLSRQLVYRS